MQEMVDILTPVVVFVAKQRGLLRKFYIEVRICYIPTFSFVQCVRWGATDTP